MTLEFSKYHGTGNDFILVDSRKNGRFDHSVEMISFLCDRHLGIGADGLIILEESAKYDFFMDFYNSDGKPGSMCGNGGRCITSFAQASGWIDKGCIFKASDGLHTALMLPDNEVKLGLNDVKEIKSLDLGIFLNTGSPHLIRFVSDLDNLDILTEGRKLRYDRYFTGGTNVNFVEIMESHIKVRTYERGVEAETLSCGTGVTASAIAASIESDRISDRVVVKTRGGDLKVEFIYDSAKNRFSNIFLTGPVRKVFSGKIEI